MTPKRTESLLLTLNEDDVLARRVYTNCKASCSLFLASIISAEAFTKTHSSRTEIVWKSGTCQEGSTCSLGTVYEWAVNECKGWRNANQAWGHLQSRVQSNLLKAAVCGKHSMPWVSTLQRSILFLLIFKFKGICLFLPRHRPFAYIVVHAGQS